MFKKRQNKNVLVILSSLFSLFFLGAVAKVYIENFHSLIGSKSTRILNSSNELYLLSSDTRLHTVRQGETLADISKKYYGSPDYGETIYEANKINIPNRLVLDPGTSLIIPYSP